MNQRENRIYFAHATNGGPIKMGATNSLQTRIQSLGSCIPGGMEVIASIPGHFRREAYLQSALAPWKLQGEWLKSCVEVWRVIDVARTAGDLAWLPIDKLRTTDQWNEEFALNSKTPGFRFIDNGRAGRQTFGRAEFAADLYHRRVPTWLLEAHGVEQVATPSETAGERA